MTDHYFEINGIWYPVEGATTVDDRVLDNKEIDEPLLKMVCTVTAVTRFYILAMDAPVSRWTVWYHFRTPDGFILQSCPFYMNDNVFSRIHRYKGVLVSQVDWKREGF